MSSLHKLLYCCILSYLLFVWRCDSQEDNSHGWVFSLDHMSSKVIRIGNEYLYLPSPVFLGLFLVFWSGFIIATRWETFVPSRLLFSCKYLCLNVVIWSPVQLITLPLGKTKQTNNKTSQRGLVNQWPWLWLNKTILALWARSSSSQHNRPL